LRFAELLDHAVDAYLMLGAVVTNHAHRRTVLRRTPAGLS
jgi:hypothetical protein